ncbi:MAG: hypothetical protein LKF34_03450 [Acidaminococcaceae bacterium]|jgi:hypothetical protein|nr:hypothetical protein [Acidaminococcaceae bacterium]
MSALAVYGGTVTAGATDGEQIPFDSEKIPFRAYREKTSDVTVLGLRAPGGADYPVINLFVTASGPAADWLEFSSDGASYSKKVHYLYIVGTNQLLYVRVKIPADADYGLHDGIYINFKYLGGV